MGAFGGININGVRVDSQYGPLKASDAISIGPFQLHVMIVRAATSAADHPQLRATDAGHQKNRQTAQASPFKLHRYILYILKQL